MRGCEGVSTKATERKREFLGMILNNRGSRVSQEQRYAEVKREEYGGEVLHRTVA
jgi:hypothetical protein